ncbi:MAG: hypothetical protein OXC05_05015 [Halieaceae bacterium]|nr:hypothetical protein [Halieaceae bacterium]
MDNSATLADTGTTRNPFDSYAYMRNQDPVHFDQQLGACLITRYEDVQQAMTSAQEGEQASE